METKLMNFLEIMNEMTVFILFSFNYLFTEYVALQEQRYFIGWGFLGLLFLNLGVNWIIIVVHSVMSIVMKVKAWCRKRHLMKIKNFDSNTTIVKKIDNEKTIEDENNESKFNDKSIEVMITKTLSQTIGTEHNLVSIEKRN